MDESLETAAGKDCTPLPLSDAVVGLTLTLMEGGGGFEFDPLLFAPQPERKTSAAKPEKLIRRPDRVKVFERTIPPRLLNKVAPIVRAR